MQPEHKVFTLELDTRCIQCGYNLRGLRSDGKCPECAAAVADAVWRRPPFAKPLKGKVSFDQDVPCVHCGEIVRSLTPLGRCVTCGSPTWHSAYGNWLYRYDASWLRRIRSGVTLWLWIRILVLVQQVAWRAIVYRWGVPSGGGSVSAWPLANMVMNIVLSVGVVIAAWRILSPIPGRYHDFTRIVLAKVVKSLVVIALLVDLACVGFSWTGGAPVGLRTLLFCLALVRPLAGVGLLWYLRGLSQRIPGSTLPRLLKVSVYVYGGLTVLHLLRYLLLGPFIFPFCLPMEWVAFGVNGFVIFVLVRTRRALGQVTP